MGKVRWLAANIAKHASRVLIRLYDVAIVLPLLAEQLVRALRRPPEARASKRWAANDVDVDVERTHA